MRWFTIALSVFVVACGEAGVREPAARDVPVRSGRVDLSIGELDGAVEYTFGSVTGLAEDAERRIYVVDRPQHVVRVFDSAGSFVRSIGREGQGPGELINPCCLAIRPGGELWVRDGGNRRYQVYDLGQDPVEAVGSVRMAHFDGWYAPALTFSSEGLLVDVGHATEGNEPLAVWRFVLSEDGTVVDRTRMDEPDREELGTVVREVKVAGGFSRSFYPQPFGPSSLVAHGPGGVWATAVSSQYVVTVHDADSVRTIRGPSFDGPVLSEGERRQARERIAGYVEGGGGTAGDYAPIPERKTPLAGIYFDGMGRLWVELSVEDGAAHRADIYDAEGVLLERREWPAEVELRHTAWIGEDHALGLTTDSLGVQRVARVVF